MAQRKLFDSTDATPRVRKIGERKESIVVLLTSEEIEDERTAVLDLLSRLDNLDAARKSLASEYKAKIEAVSTAMAASRHAATTGKRAVEVYIEDWLTRSGEVVRVRADTGETIGKRPARSDELQEPLFDARDASAHAPDPAFPNPGDAFGQ
jgi:hypothetical protein